MKDLTKYYIDLGKCSEEQQKHIIPLLPKPEVKQQYTIGGDFKYLHYDGDFGWWVDKEFFITEKTELTYPEFIKLFEGGEDYPGKQYQPLFDHLNSEHGLILHESEMNEIIRIVGGLNSNR